jgi:acetyl-CoA C-acetyltransferase
MTATRPSAYAGDRPVYICDGCRTPFLKARGVPGAFSAADLAVGAGRPLLARQPFAAGRIDQVILGCVAPGPDEANIARVVALRLGIDERVPAWTVQRNCASGLQAVASAATEIADGRAELVLAGGTESMSHHPVLWSRAMVEWLGHWSRARSAATRGRLLLALRPAMLAPVIALLKGLTDPVVGLSMGQTAEELATRFGIDREAMDRFALESHRRVVAGRKAGLFDDEIVPLIDPDGQVYAADDGVRPDADAGKLARLKPVFDRPVGRVTAGNSAQVTDGAAWLLLASAPAVQRHGLRTLAQVQDTAWAALDPRVMGLGPVHAMAPLLARNGLGSADIAHWEINEAFAAQVLACQAAWADPDYRREQLGPEAAERGDPAEIPDERLNPHGGAVALGHPVGASGARLALHLALSLARTGARHGVASLCIGGGQGGAMLLTNPDGDAR